jgi:hypothetical protein
MSTDSFTIKRTINDEVILKIPSGVISPSLDKPGDLIKRFKWDSNNHFRFINHNNMEKLYEINFNTLSLTQIGYGQVPFLDSKKFKDKSLNFYMDSRVLTPNAKNVFPRLMRSM